MTETSSTIWVIELRNPQISMPLKLRIEDKITVGRAVPGEAKRPDVDLSTIGAEALGVSRQHVEITPEADRLVVKDLDSNNGSFINGNRLKADEPYRLGHGDQLMLGRLRLEVAVILSPAYGGDVHKQPSLQLQDQMQPGKGQLVLIVQKDAEVSGVIASVMERAGYTTKVNYEVVGAIRTYNQRRPSAIIVDPVLPDMSGLEFCRYVRRDVVKNVMPLVVIHTGDDLVDVTETMQTGADIFLEKPISARELRHVVSSLIAHHEGGNAAIYTKHLVGTAPLKAVPPETRQNSAVLFVAGYADAPVVLNVQQPVSFGRTASTGSLKHHVDLSRYEAANAGVSRLHMLLHFRDGKFFIEDRDSVNGTYLNGDPVKPRLLTAIRNADEIRLGQLRMYIYFLEDRDQQLLGGTSG